MKVKLVKQICSPCKEKATYEWVRKRNYMVPKQITPDRQGSCWIYLYRLEYGGYALLSYSVRPPNPRIDADRGAVPEVTIRCCDPEGHRLPGDTGLSSCILSKCPTDILGAFEKLGWELCNA